MKKFDAQSLKERLSKYSLIAAGLIGSEEAISQSIIYTDEAPDIVSGVNEEYFLDMNNDGTDDFRIFQNQIFSSSFSTYSYYSIRNRVRVSPLTSANEVLGSSYPYNLNAGTPISSGAPFSNSTSQSLASVSFGSYSGSFWGPYSYGNWVGATEKFLGVRFDIGGNTHYGWVRLSVSASGDEFTVLDYAYEATPGEPIDAGDIQAYMASNIVGSDIANNTFTETDLQVDFDAASDENTVADYDVIAVKDAAAATFTLADAQALPAASIVTVNKGTGPYTVVFPQSTLDSDGDAIINGQPYSIFVVSNADGTNANVSNISKSTATVTLNNTAGINEANIFNDILVYSNGNQINIKTPLDLLASNLEVSLITTQGQILGQKSIKNEMTSISYDQLSSGLYFIKISDTNGNIKSIKIRL